MARLTEEQKAANKVAQRVRDRAFAARRKAYYEAKKAAQDSASRAEFDAANTAFEEELSRRNAAIDNTRKQIEELQAHLNNIKEAYEPTIEALKTAKNKAWKKWQAREEELVDAVDARFPDMVGRYSVVGWKMPEEENND